MTSVRLRAFSPDDDTPVFVISVAAELAGMHAQTLRQYDRLGLVTPSRTRGGGRRYSQRDVALLREVQRLSQEEGVSLPGIARILELENQVTALRSRVAELGAELEACRRPPGAPRGSSRCRPPATCMPRGSASARGTAARRPSSCGTRPRALRPQAGTQRRFPGRVAPVSRRGERARARPRS